MLKIYHPLPQKAVCTILQNEMQEPGTEVQRVFGMVQTPYPYPPQNGLMHLKHCLALGHSWANLLKSEVFLNIKATMEPCKSSNNHTVFFPKTLEMDYISHYLTPAHPEMATRWCWRSITRSPKKQCARFYRMKCRSLAQKCKESLVWYKHHIHIHHRMAWCT